MPYIQINTNLSVTEEQHIRLKDAFGRAIESFPGKTEQWLMVECNPDRKLYFRGSDAPCAMVCVELFGQAQPAAYDRMTQETCRIMEETLGLDPASVYVKYEEIGQWGYNNMNF